MTRGKSITFGTVTFPTLKKAEGFIRLTLAAHGFHEEFESVLLSALFFERHHHCSFYGLRPMRFVKRPAKEAPTNPHAYNLYGFLPGTHEWHDMSWRKCIHPPTTMQRGYAALRLRVASLWRGALLGPGCQRCGAAGDLQLHHAQPSFIHMADLALAGVTEEEVFLLGRGTWDKQERFTFPEGHRAVVEFDRLHAEAVTETLCRRCHIKVTWAEDAQGA
jgi:hypothetical protein